MVASVYLWGATCNQHAQFGVDIVLDVRRMLDDVADEGRMLAISYVRGLLACIKHTGLLKIIIIMSFGVRGGFPRAPEMVDVCLLSKLEQDTEISSI